MIKVIHPGIYSSIQDLGRKGFANIGVPISGVMDAYSMRIGNQILNNHQNDAVIEVTFGGAIFQFENPTRICISGADFNPMLDEKPIIMNTSLEIQKGTILTFGKREKGIRTYICVLGGILSEEVLTSKSFYKGITINHVLKKGDHLNIGKGNRQTISSNSKVKLNEEHFTSKNIICTKGPEFDLLPKAKQQLLLETMFTISNNNNRMGYQLEEPVENELPSILTSGVLPGTVQLTPSGKLIVLMKDCQVTGGYPRVLQLTENSIHQLAQKSTLDKIQFVL